VGYNGLKRIVQVCILVKNIEKARALWAELLDAAEPPITETSDGRVKLTFFNLENIDLELIQPISGPSNWQDFLEKCGEGIHHIAFHVKKMDETLGKFRNMGIEVEQRGEFEGGGYVYMGSKDKLGAIIELLAY